MKTSAAKETNLSAPQAEAEVTDTFSIQRPARVGLSAEETRERMEAFADERREAFIAAVRKDEA